MPPSNNLFKTQELSVLHPIPVKFVITIDPRQTQLITLFTFLIGLIYFQVKMCMNKLTF